MTKDKGADLQSKNNEMTSQVVLLPCDSYDESEVYPAIARGIELLGGLDAVLGSARSVLVKPNLLKPASADSAVTTHPAVISAVLRALAEAGGYEVSYGDSPGHDSGEKVLGGIGMLDPAMAHGAKLAPMLKEKKCVFPEGLTAKEFFFAQEVPETDCVINVCKMKTHALMTVTGAVKNPFGLICGARKPMMHVLYPEEGAFAGMLADIHRAVPIPLHIMDAVVAMEGNGPGSGDPVPMGLILMSRDPVAIDAVFCRLIGLDPKLVTTNIQGERAGIGTYHEERIGLVLANAESARNISWEEMAAAFSRPGFKVDRQKKGIMGRLLRVLAGVKGRPVIDQKRCIRCGICVEHCPVEGHALHFSKGRNHPPVYDYRKCIRCYCCQEMCPRKAIRKGGAIFRN